MIFVVLLNLGFSMILGNAKLRTFTHTHTHQKQNKIKPSSRCPVPSCARRCKSPHSSFCSFTVMLQGMCQMWLYLMAWDTIPRNNTEQRLKKWKLAWNKIARQTVWRGVTYLHLGYACAGSKWKRLSSIATAIQAGWRWSAVASPGHHCFAQPVWRIQPKDWEHCRTWVPEQCASTVVPTLHPAPDELWGSCRSQALTHSSKNLSPKKWDGCIATLTETCH